MCSRIAALYTATLVGLLQSWLHYGMKHDEERFVERVARLTDGTHAPRAGAQLRGGERRERLLALRGVRGGAGPGWRTRWDRRCPGRFHPERPPFRSRGNGSKTAAIYTRLAIEKWKKLVPDMSRLLPDMVKKELPGSGAVTAAQADGAGAGDMPGGAGTQRLLPAGAGVSVAVARLRAARSVLAVWVLLANLPFMLIQTLQPAASGAPGGAAAEAGAAERRAQVRVLILTCNTGGGHNAVAAALQ